MTRVYENRGFNTRSNVSIVVLVVVIIYGFWELWNAFGSAESDSLGAMFGVLFVGGGLYGMKMIWDEGVDLAFRFDADLDANRGRIMLWRPFRPLVLEPALDAMTGWHHWVKLGRRNQRTHYLVARVAGYPRPLYFEIPMDQPVAEGFRRLAPEAVEELEVNSGRRKSE